MLSLQHKADVEKIWTASSQKNSIIKNNCSKQRCISIAGVGWLHYEAEWRVLDSSKIIFIFNLQSQVNRQTKSCVYLKLAASSF